MKAEYPKALEVQALAPYRLRIRWSTGELLDVDVEAKLAGVPCLKPILAPDIFSRAHAGEHGTTVEWVDAEFGADNVYAWTVEQLGQPSHEMLADWMRRNDLSLAGTATALGLSRRMVAYYRSGARRIPRVVWLACLGWEATRKRSAA